MKLTKLLTINDKPYPLNTDAIKLDLQSPGRASFTVVASEKLNGIVKFSLGYDPENLQQYFCGVVENCYQVDAKQQTIFAREFSAVLAQILPIALRNVTLVEVLKAVGDATGLEFVTPDQPYATKKIPVFYCVGGGFHLMDSLARVFRIPQFTWQQQGDGKIFVGSWAHSFWSDKPIELPVEAQADSGLFNSCKLPAVPRLRPGVKHQGGIITSVNLSDAMMEIEWVTNPWGNRWKNKSTVQ